MIFLPKGAINPEVVDPELIARDAMEAQRIAQLTTQYQWASSAFTDIGDFVKGQPWNLRANVKSTAYLGTSPGVWPIIKNDGGADATQWIIPYNRGFFIVRQGLGNEASGTWTSTYPEMVLTIFSGWYVRRSATRAPYSTYFTGSGRGIRAQFRIRVDGQDKAGTGPFRWPLDGKNRGVGYGSQALACCFLDISHVPAGTHHVAMMAAQGPASGSSATEEIDTYTAGTPVEGAVIGSFGFLVATMPFGKALGA